MNNSKLVKTYEHKWHAGVLAHYYQRSDNTDAVDVCIVAVPLDGGGYSISIGGLPTSGLSLTARLACNAADVALEAMHAKRDHKGRRGLSAVIRKLGTLAEKVHNIVSLEELRKLDNWVAVNDNSHSKKNSDETAKHCDATLSR